MRLQEAAKMLGGSIVIYVVMAACAASSGVNPGFVDGGAGEGNESSVGGSSGGGTSASGADGSGGGSGSGSSSGAIASGSGTDGSGGGSGSDGPSILDAITDPVSSANADVNQSGTRLKANYYAGADGSKQFLFTFHDTQLNVDCSFSKASDGTMRCIPITSGATVAASVYADANCTQPIALVSQCPGTTMPTQVSAQIGTSGATHTFAIGAASTVASVYYLVPAANPSACNPGGVNGYTYTCSPYPASAWTTLQANSTTYGIGAEILAPLPTMFVQATAQTEP